MHFLRRYAMREVKTVLDIASFFKSTGMTETLDFSVPMPPEQSEFSDVTVVGKMKNTADVVSLKVTVSGLYKTECDRCLDEVSVPLEAEIDTIVTENESKDDSVTVNVGKIDLVKTAYDALSLEIPLIVHCSEDCKGICQGCGANLNHEACRCEQNDGEL